MVRDGRLLDTLDRRGDKHMYYSSSSSSSKKRDDRHRYHPFKRSNRGYFPDEFKKAKPPTFDGEMNKSQDAEVWFLGIRKFFRLHDYSDNMKTKIATFSLRGKADIWWEYVNNVRGIHEENFTWNEFEWLFKNKYLLERYFDDRARELYQLKMGSMIDYGYSSKLLELLRYVPYLKEEKAKIHRFTSGLPMT